MSRSATTEVDKRRCHDLLNILTYYPIDTKGFKQRLKIDAFLDVLVSSSTICIISNLHCIVILNNNFNDDIGVNAKDNDNENNDIIVIHVIIKSERRLYK